VYKESGKGMVPTHVDRQKGSAVLVTGQHPGVVEEFINVYLEELER
jgi:hypothetical protein